MAGSIYVPILSSFNPAGVNNARKSLSGLSGAFDGVKRSLGLASAGFVAFRAVSETIDFGRSSILAARDLERNLIGLDAVFGELSPKMEQFARDGVEIGLSQSEAAKASTFLGSVLKQAGFEMGDVANQTENLVSLASDLAFTYGYDVSEALSGMTALFRGEYDPIEKFGVAMKQSEVNAVLAANGQDKLAGAARRNAEQVARLALLYQRTQDAQGAFKNGSGSLFVEQQKLQAIFANLQAEVGKALIPALVGVAQALQPLVTTLAPAINAIFEQFAKIITILAGEISNVSSNLNNMLTLFGGLFSLLVDILPFILDNALAFGVFAATFVTIRGAVQLAAGAMLAYETATAAAAVANGTFAASFAFTPWGAIAIAVAAIAGGMVLLYPAMQRATDATKGFNSELDITIEAAKKDPFKSLTLSSLNYSIALDGIIGKMTQLNYGRKITASELIASNYGVGAGKAVIGASDETEQDKLAEKLKTVLKNFEDAAEATASASKKAASSTKEPVDELTNSFKKQEEALKDFKKSIADILPALKPLEIATRDIGEFEQSTIDSFKNIADKVDESFREGIITNAAQRELKDYLAIEKTAFLAINRQRDELVKKRGLAETLISDIKAAIIGVGGLAGLLETETRQVTTATTKIVDGFTITTKRTVDEIVGGQGVLSKLSAVVAKTKAFAGQLTQLRKLGLNENLFKQVVEAGPDVGGQLAVEILAGGADAVGALNTTFKELEDVAGQVAEQTAQVMYGSGVDVSKGLVAGLLAQEQALVAAAETLANAFINAFNALMAKLQIPSLSDDTVTNAGGFAYNTALAGVSGDDSQFGMGTPWAQTIANFRASQAPVTNNYITVKGSVVTEKELGQYTLASQNRYTKSSGG
jgi:hypothetical protein